MVASAEELRRENAPVAVKKLVSFVLADFEKACSFRHLLTVFGSLGAMFPIAVMMRAATVSRRTAVRIDFASDDPVVLFLRSFSTDGVFHDETRFFLGIQHLSEEEEIAELSRDSELGQFVGFARPGERYQELGAERTNIGSEDWREAVSKLVARARAVVMWLGDSESLLWELDAVVQSGSVDRTLFLIPAATSESQLREKYDNLWCKIAGRPGYSRFPSNMRGDERFLYFHRDGRAEVVTETARSKKDVGSLLAPFFAHVGVALPGKPFSPDALVGNLLRFCVGGYPIVVYFARYVR